MMINYALGFIKSAKLVFHPPEHETRVRKPTLVINATRTERIQSNTLGWIEEPMSPQLKLMIIPFDKLETQSKCEEWITSRLAAMNLALVTAQIMDPKLLLVGLIWNMKEKWEAGEMGTIVVEMDWVEVAELRKEFRERVVDVWVNHKAKDCEGKKGSCCAVCLDDLDENSKVLELPCGHVFHCGCIEVWLKRKFDCPCCRGPAIALTFWVHSKVRDGRDPPPTLCFPYL